MNEDNFQINIARKTDDGKMENFFYQSFIDYQGGIVREVIRVINGFPKKKQFEYFNKPVMSFDKLNDLTIIAQKKSILSGRSTNAELIELINDWMKENL